LFILPCCDFLDLSNSTTVGKAVGIVLLSDDFTESDGVEIARALDAEKSVNIIILLGSKFSVDFLSQIAEAKLNDRVVEIQYTDLISGFHLAKNKLDSVMCPSIKIICKRKQEITFLCQVFFTPAVKWNVEAIGKPTSNNQETMESTTKKVRDYVRGIKTTDDISIIKSKLIPNDIFYHGFSTRTGGLCCIPRMKSLDMVYRNAKREPLILIEENRRRLAAKAGFDVNKLMCTETPCMR
jgi:hypothetical protein